MSEISYSRETTVIERRKQATFMGLDRTFFGKGG
jgi:hypothetical protein